MTLDRISSGRIKSGFGNSFSAIEIDGDGVVIRNSTDEANSSGNLVGAGNDQVLSSSRTTGTTINASYIKTGVLDANLMRAGLIQTVPSWNTKWYGAPEDHAAVQMGFTGGSIAATAVSTGTGTLTLTLPSSHGIINGDYVRVSGLYFTTGTLLGSVGLNLPTNGPVDYASATGTQAAISTVARTTTTATITTSSAHGFIVGDSITIALTSGPTGYAALNGTWTITTSATATTFTFTTGTSGTITSGAAVGTAIRNKLTYSKSDITSPLTVSPNTTVYVGKANTVTAVLRTYDDPSNPAELSTVTVTTSAAHGFIAGDYVELVNVAQTIDGVAYVTTVPTSTTFTYKQRFGDDLSIDLSVNDFPLPSILAPVAIKVLKAYTQNSNGSIRISSTGGSSITSTNFTLDSDGYINASGGVFDPITTALAQRAALTVRGNSTEGDIATTAETNITLGYRSGANAIGGTFYPILKVMNPASGLAEGTVAVFGGMTVTDSIQSTNGLAGDNVLQTFVTTDANNRFKLEQDGKMSWGPGSAAVDTNLYRNGPSELKTDDDFTSTGIVTGAIVASYGAVTAAGVMTATNISLSGTNGLRHDTPAPTSGTGQIAGEAMWVQVSGTNYQLRRSTGTSWARFKDNIEPTSIAPEQFAALNFVQFDWNRAALLEQYPDLDSVDASKQHGLLLDQLVNVLPEAVQHPTNSTDTETVNWHAVHIASMVALQDAIKRIAELEERLAALES
jgi:hypothetical protein